MRYSNNIERKYRVKKVSSILYRVSGQERKKKFTLTFFIFSPISKIYLKPISVSQLQKIKLQY